MLPHLNWCMYLSFLYSEDWWNANCSTCIYNICYGNDESDVDLAGSKCNGNDHSYEEYACISYRMKIQGAPPVISPWKSWHGMPICLNEFKNVQLMSMADEGNWQSNAWWDDISGMLTGYVETLDELPLRMKCTNIKFSRFSFYNEPPLSPVRTESGRVVAY